MNRFTFFGLSAFGAVLLVLSGVRFSDAWTLPTLSAPSGNTPAPINVSATDQTKNGQLTLDTLTVNTNATLGGTFQAPSLTDVGNTGYSVNPQNINRMYQINADRYCDANGNNCVTTPGGSTGISNCQVCLYSNFGGQVCTGATGASYNWWRDSGYTGLISSHGDHGNDHGYLQVMIYCY